MPLLYLFTLNDIIARCGDRYLAIPSKIKNQEYERLQIGEFTSTFNQKGLIVDYVKDKHILEFSSDVYNSIVIYTNRQSCMLVRNNDGKYSIVDKSRNTILDIYNDDNRPGYVEYSIKLLET
jgi:predicted choloylglycine hydrolase